MLSTNAGWIIAAVVAMGSFLAWFVRSTIKSELFDFRLQLEDKFDRKFQDAKVASMQIDGIKADIDSLRKHLNEVEEYAHSWRHKHAGPLQKCVLKLGIESPKDEF